MVTRWCVATREEASLIHVLMRLPLFALLLLCGCVVQKGYVDANGEWHTIARQAYDGTWVPAGDAVASVQSFDDDSVEVLEPGWVIVGSEYIRVDAGGVVHRRPRPEHFLRRGGGGGYAHYGGKPPPQHFEHGGGWRGAGRVAGGQPCFTCTHSGVARASMGGFAGAGHPAAAAPQRRNHR